MRSLILLFTILASPAYAGPSSAEPLNTTAIPSGSTRPEPTIPPLEAIRGVLNAKLWQAVERPDVLPDGDPVDVFVIDDGEAHGAGVSAIIRDLACDTPDDCSIEVHEYSFEHLSQTPADDETCADTPDNQACLILQIRRIIESQANIDTPTIINLSLGWEVDSNLPLMGALEDAADAGILVLASVGNRTHDSSKKTDERGALMPAVWESEGASDRPIIYAVGATDFEGAPLSTQRADAIPLRNAPGVLLMSREFNEQASHGTSGATAVVTALAAVTWSLDPQLSAEEVMAHVDLGKPGTLAGETTDLCYAAVCASPHLISFRMTLAGMGMDLEAERPLSPLSSERIQAAWRYWKKMVPASRKDAVIPQGKIAGCDVCINTIEKLYLKLSNPGPQKSYGALNLLTSTGRQISVQFDSSLSRTLIIGAHADLSLDKDESIKSLSYELHSDGDQVIEYGLSPVMQAH